MSKKAFLAIFLSLLIIIGYNYFITQKYPPVQPEDVTQQTEPVFPARQPQREAVGPAPDILPMQPEKRGSLVAPEAKSAREVLVETDLVRLVITSSGARIKSYQLKKYPEEKISIQAVQTRLSEIDQAQARSLPETREFLQREKGKQEILLDRLIRDADRAELISLPALLDADFSPALTFPDDEKTSFTLNTALYQCAQGGLALSPDQPEGQLIFTYTDTQGRRIDKTYSFSNYNYGIGLSIKFQGWMMGNVGGDHFLLYNGPDVGMPQAQRGRRTYGYQGPVSCFQTGQQSWTLKEKYARNEKNIFVRREHREKGKVLWTGLENKYFLSALLPLQAAESVIIERNRAGEQKVAMAVPWEGSGVYNFKLYLGPKKKERLQEIDASLKKVIDYGIFSFIANFIYQILVFFSRWTHNFGWAIILLCLVTKTVFYPLTHRSFESMQKMQHEMKAIQPEMDGLREHFKDNPQKLNKEILELYRKRGINPMASCQSGCLPLLLQMPVFFALYGVLYNSIELRGAPFIGWVTDLSAKDPYYVLPVLMGVSMFVQQKLTGMGTTSAAQQQQAKMMSVLMPVFLTWIFASLPSGVVLYWFTFNIVTALQQLLIRRKQEVVSAE